MIRKYSNKDKPKIIELLRKNTPAYFAPSEEADFVNYLDYEVEDYFVYEEDARIIGAGGINYFPKLKLARISWDIIAPNSQGKGVGRKLTQHRLHHLKERGNIELVVVRTTQLAHKFYEKMGFELEKTEKDFWAKGFDLYQMTMSNKK
ncbi:N-acetylglutamate synthase, GNAT family [Zobellia uliginosa]|uniref:N-acetylglutamate synthase, GNAT family n=1 Tax=Zobellia uliginosa TaxID=143224 RepID=A0ABY1KTF6_9FLAO|nr:GNAT family N-acetyltransferase [Zobellia uliginosa]SIS73751.1 N-acetylglutamate synthase, GNAT family [Zobellia uliginosa]